MIKNIQLLAILLLPVYFILPTGENSHFTICPFFHLTGVPCPGCGMGRALVHIFHLHFIEALYFNPFGFLVAAAQCYVILSFFFPSLITVYDEYKGFFVVSQFLFPFLGYSLSTIQPILCPGSVYLWGFIYWLRLSSHLGFRYGKCVFTTVFL